MIIKHARLVFAEREEISKGIYAFENLSKIAKRIDRSPSTIIREIKKQTKYKWCYSAEKGEKISREKKKKSVRKKKLESNKSLLNYVHSKLKIEWSPEEIAQRIKKEYPLDTSMRISHETIYQYLYCLARGELKKELISLYNYGLPS